MTLSIGAPSDKSGLSAEDLLFIAQNPDKLAEVLNQIKDERGKLNAKIALAGPAEEILNLREAAKTASAEAHKAWDIAQKAADKVRADAAGLIKGALDKAAEIKSEAEDHAAKLTVDAEKFSREAQDHAAKAGDKISEAKRREDAVLLREQAIGEREAAADGTKKIYEQKLADLKSRLAGV